jgi:hypothetical protein
MNRQTRLNIEGPSVGELGVARALALLLRRRVAPLAAALGRSAAHEAEPCRGTSNAKSGAVREPPRQGWQANDRPQQAAVERGFRFRRWFGDACTGPNGAAPSRRGGGESDIEVGNLVIEPREEVAHNGFDYRSFVPLASERLESTELHTVASTTCVSASDERTRTWASMDPSSPASSGSTVFAKWSWQYRSTPRRFRTPSRCGRFC